MSLLEESAELANRLSEYCVGEKAPVVMMALIMFLSLVIQDAGGLPDLQDRLTMLRLAMVEEEAKLKAATN